MLTMILALVAAPHLCDVPSRYQTSGMNDREIAATASAIEAWNQKAIEAGGRTLYLLDSARGSPLGLHVRRSSYGLHTSLMVDDDGCITRADVYIPARLGLTYDVLVRAIAKQIGLASGGRENNRYDSIFGSGMITREDAQEVMP